MRIVRGFSTELGIIIETLVLGGVHLLTLIPRLITVLNIGA